MDDDEKVTRPVVTLMPKYTFGEAEAEMVESQPTLRHFVPEVKEKILTAKRASIHSKIAAEYAGIDERTLDRWLKLGKDAGPDSAGVNRELYDFYKAVTVNDATGKVTLHSWVYDAAKKNPGIALALLEKLDPDVYGKKTERDERPVGDIVIHQLKKLTDTELITLKQITIKARKSEDEED